MLDLILFQRAFLACLVIGFTNGYTSGFVLLNRSPLKLSALSHSLMPGIAIATIVVGLSVISAFVGAVLMAILIGVLSLLLSRNSKLSQDTNLAILYTGSFALGIVILNRMGHSQELEHWLFGNILGLGDMDLIMSCVIGVIAIAILTLFQRPILITLFEPNVAITLGVPVRIVHYTSFALLILVLVTTLQAVGCILAIGLIVTPGATVRLFTNNPRDLFLYSGILGATGSCTGLAVGYYLDLPAESSIVICLTLLFLVAFGIRAGLTHYHKSSIKLSS